MDPSTLEKILGQFAQDNDDIIIGYKIAKTPLLSEVVKKLSPGFSPETMSFFVGSPDMRKKELASMSASFLHDAPEIQVHSPRSENIYRGLASSLEKDSYRDFCIHTPSCVHPYWPEIKSVFDRHTYR